MTSHPTADPYIGRLLDGRYRVDDLVARGGMATVYRATDTRLARTVAVKILSGTFANDPDFVARFSQEARASAALTHPNVVAVHDQGVAEGFPFLVMEFVAGRTIRDVVHDSGPLTSAHALEIMTSVLAGLGAAHAAGFIHRDIKPENVLITDSGHVKVTDFGLARVIDDTPVSDSTGAVLLGTMAYLSPEQVQQQSLDQRSDVYSAGILLFEMLTGRVPFTGTSPLDVAYMHVNQDVPAPSSFQPDVPPAVDHLVLAATHRNPNDRLHSAEAFLDGVNRAAQAVPAVEALTTVIPVNQTLVLEAPTRGAHRASAAQPAQPSQVVRHSHTRRIAVKKKHRRRRAVVILALLAIVGIVGYKVTGSYVAMPQVVGLTVDEAKTKVSQVGLTSLVTKDFSETIPSGTVLSTIPDAGVKARKGRDVTIVISKGQERYIIPKDLAGTDPSKAQNELEDLTLNVTGTKQVYDDKIKIGQVVRTAPAGGTKVKRETGVVLYVSKGPAPVTIPGLAGQPLSTVKAQLSKLGLKSEVVSEVFDASPEGSVISSDPAPGQVVPRGSTVNLTVSKGPPLIAVPDVVGKKKAAAIKLLEDAGFTVVAVNMWSYVVLNEVWEQSVKAGTLAPRGSTITIRIV